MTQYLTEGEDADPNEKPSCALSTRTWAQKGLSFLHVLVGIDKVEPRLGIYKEGWALPIGRKTRVSLMSWASALTFEVAATDTGHLSGSLDPEQIGTERNITLNLTLNLIFNTRGNGMAVTIRFDGNEPQWTIPPTEPLEAYEVTSALRRCVTDLKQRGGSFYPEAGPADGEAATSPFNESNDSASSPKISSEAGAAPVSPTAAEAATEWRFDTAEEDWGKTCFAEMQSGDVRVGFMASPGKAATGYVEGLFSGGTRATWRVDDGIPYVSDGSENGYFGWHQFDQLSEELLTDVAGGNELAVTNLDGKRIVVPLDGAKQALLSFAECVGKPKPASNAESPQADPQPVSKHDRSCLLEVKGKKVIDGPCSWGPYGSSGPAFQMTANGYFAILMMENADYAVGYWNETANSTHAHAKLGRLSRSGNCWGNKKVRMCPRR
ncbi:hypothetical protein GOB18_07890 [Sinorhizobium meliloti]|nr:hypothetical protein [Sinorhizobium meliloti]MDW9453686.1 hypothetical protein [Sinorhizobium meliloti]